MLMEFTGKFQNRRRGGGVVSTSILRTTTKNHIPNVNSHATQAEWTSTSVLSVH